ncbi:protein patched homolog 1-like [Argopecten irradians]|uniref:protein patched homolog 1-like n=1 Tax=Argopecten irradians TaxID=31199 RepID=UPI0037235177
MYDLQPYLKMKIVALDSGATMTVRRKGNNKELEDELFTRTSWVNAEEAYRQVKKGKADGNKSALWLRCHLQNYLFAIGSFIDLHCGKVLFVGLLLLSLCCVGLKTAKIETNIEELWVEEGGRLEEELDYTRNTVNTGSGITSELIIQTPKVKGSNLLDVQSLQLHLETLRKVTQIQVDMFEQSWNFKDLCFVADFPEFEDIYLNAILSHIKPCIIMTPLDCFWDGSKLLGPERDFHPELGIQLMKWTNLNPEQLIAMFEDQIPSVYLEAVRDVMSRAGVTTAYQEKPCLDPTDPNCPSLAPNKQSRELPDIGGALTGGCYGFATKYMHWHEDLIVGGITRNKTGHIVRAQALQSIVQLMDDQQLYDFFKVTSKTISIDWTPDKAKAILEAWQRKFAQVVNGMGNSTSPDQMLGFSTTSLMDIMKEFSNVSIVRVVFGYVLMLFYSCISLLRWNNGVQSQSGIGVAGVLLVALSVAAGLGICSVLGIPFNASTTQIIPFLALGLGVDDMFLIAHTYYENGNKKTIAYTDQTAECLKRTGVSVLLTSLNNMLAFFSAAIIPIPALRAFSLQAGILILFNLGSVLLVFPAICSWDLKRKEDKRVDIFCCIQSYAENNNNTVIDLAPSRNEFEMRDQSPPPRYSPPPPSYTPSPPPSYNAVVNAGPDGDHVVTSLAPEGLFVARPSPLPSLCQSTTSSRQCLTPDDRVSCRERFAQAQRECLSLSLTSFATRRVGPFLKKPPVKVFTVLSFVIVLLVSIYGITKVKDGLDLTDIVPKGTNEYKFLDAQSDYFGFYNIYLVTKGDFDYPNNQPLLLEYHKSFQSVGKIIKREDGSLPNFWLIMFRQWLEELQSVFDREYLEGRLYRDGWHSNASDSGILAYKLLIQTGDVDTPYDKNLFPNNRMVEDGIIAPNAFYSYLTAWTSNDPMAYTASMADFHPPTKDEPHDSYDYELKISKAQPLIYAQIPFYLTNLSDTEDILHTIKMIRAICDSFSERGLPNFPSGVPFTFWEQYIHLRFYLMLSILCILVVTFIVLTIVLMNPWLASIVVVVLTMIVVELFGMMGLTGIKLSAVPAVIIIVSVGIGVEFTVHVAVGFLTAIGSRNRRTVISLQHTFAPVVHGAISTLLGIVMLLSAEFEFIVKYFFNVLAALVLIGLFNGLVLLPVLLSLFGPKGEVRPKGEHPDRLETPSPEPSPKPKKKVPVRTTRSSRRLYPRVASDNSLTTITEEPSQYSSHEIIVEPEVVVETTQVPMGVNCDSNSSSRNSTPPGSTASTPLASHVTRVKATATVKVEVHTPIIPGGTVEMSVANQNRKSKRRKLKELENSDSDSSTKS